MTSSNILWPRMITKSFAHALDTPHRITRLTHFGLALWCLLLSARPGMAGESNPQSTRTWHYYCSSDQGQSTQFFSGTFDVTAAPGTPGADPSKISDAFKQSLVDEYGYDGDAVCFGNFKTTDAARAGEQKRISDLRAAKKSKIVETGWTYNGNRKWRSIRAGCAAGSHDTGCWNWVGAGRIDSSEFSNANSECSGRRDNPGGQNS
jgi:hypothetical protein